MAIALVGAAACAGSASAQFAVSDVAYPGVSFRSGGDYVLDDGTGETNLGWSAADPGGLIGLNEFTVQAGQNLITDIHIAPGTNPAGEVDITLLIFANPTGNAQNITSSDLLYRDDRVLVGEGSDDFQDFSVPNVDVGDIGDSFLVGFYSFSRPDQFPHRIDTTDPQGMSWAAGGADPFDPSDPNAAPGLPLTNLSGFAFNGNFMIRASAVPAPGSAALLALGGLVAMRRRR